MSEPTEFLCKDCSHATVRTIDKIMTFGNPHYFSYKCSLYIIDADFDPVVGDITPASIGYCSSARCNGQPCGPTGTKWTPKTIHGLFTLLKK